MGASGQSTWLVVSTATDCRRIEESVTFDEVSVIVSKEHDRSYDPVSIRASAAKLAWFQEGN
jgi:hypothetical protein